VPSHDICYILPDLFVCCFGAGVDVSNKPLFSPAEKAFGKNAKRFLNSNMQIMTVSKVFFIARKVGLKNISVLRIYPMEKFILKATVSRFWKNCRFVKSLWSSPQVVDIHIVQRQSQCRGAGCPQTSTYRKIHQKTRFGRLFSAIH